jgi:hypothetical protein
MNRKDRTLLVTMTTYLEALAPMAMGVAAGASVWARARLPGGGGPYPLDVAREGRDHLASCRFAPLAACSDMGPAQVQCGCGATPHKKAANG